MISSRAFLFVCCAVALSVTTAFATTTHRASNAGHTSVVHRTLSHFKPKGHAQTRGHKMHGQQAIEPERVTQIQEALAREHYLSGQPNGQWDSATQAAMQKYQADQGWQTKLMPDSRALVKLGLGPDYSSAINARDIASAPPPPPASSQPSQQTAGFAAAAGVNR